MSATGPQVVSLFSGIGGLDLGARLANLNTTVAADVDEAALKRLAEALGTPTKQGDLALLELDNLLDSRAGSAGTPSYLIGGPPCTAFSHAGFWIDQKRKGEDDQRNRIGDYTRFLEELRPRAFLLENVPGLLFKNHRSVFDDFVASAKALGYATSHDILNAKDFGIPQARRRVFVIGVLGNGAFRMPRGPFADADARTTGWAFEDLTDENNPPEDDERLRGKYEHLLPDVPEGDNYLHFTEKRGHKPPIFGWRKKYWSFLLKLHRDRPSPTIPATRISNNGPFHWDNRRLRVRETARLMGFPDEYPLADPRLARRHLGNAVPPLLAAEVLWQLSVFLGDAVGSERPEALREAMDPAATALEVSQALSAPLTTRSAAAAAA